MAVIRKSERLLASAAPVIRWQRDIFHRYWYFDQELCPACGQRAEEPCSHRRRSIRDENACTSLALRREIARMAHRVFTPERLVLPPRYPVKVAHLGTLQRARLYRPVNKGRYRFPASIKVLLNDGDQVQWPIDLVYKLHDASMLRWLVLYGHLPKSASADFLRESEPVSSVVPSWLWAGREAAA